MSSLPTYRFISVFISTALTLSLAITSSCTSSHKKALATIKESNQSSLSGKISFSEKDGIVTMYAMIENASEGMHAIHIHEKGDCSSPDAKSAGGHWNPTGESHGKWGVPPFHKGDIGNLQVRTGGKAVLKIKTDLWCIGCADPQKNILEKAIIIHQGQDDFQSQPSGMAGIRVGCGRIEVE